MRHRTLLSSHITGKESFMTATLESTVPASAELDLEQMFLFVAALRGGDFSARLNEEALAGRAHEIARNLNRFAQQMQQLTSEIAHSTAPAEFVGINVRPAERQLPQIVNITAQ